MDVYAQSMKERSCDHVFPQYKKRVVDFTDGKEPEDVLLDTRHRYVMAQKSHGNPIGKQGLYTTPS